MRPLMTRTGKLESVMLRSAPLMSMPPISSRFSGLRREYSAPFAMPLQGPVGAIAGKEYWAGAASLVAGDFLRDILAGIVCNWMEYCACLCLQGTWPSRSTGQSCFRRRWATSRILLCGIAADSTPSRALRCCATARCCSISVETCGIPKSSLSIEAGFATTVPWVQLVCGALSGARHVRHPTQLCHGPMRS